MNSSCIAVNPIDPKMDTSRNDSNADAQAARDPTVEDDTSEAEIVLQEELVSAVETMKLDEISLTARSQKPNSQRRMRVS